MMFLDKTPVESFQGSAPHHEDGQGQKPGEGNVAGRIVNLYLVESLLSSLKPRGDPLLWRKDNTAFRVEPQKEAPADHIPGRSVRLRPVPLAAELLREKEPAPVRITGDELPYILYLPFAEYPAPVANPFIHHPYVA